MLNLYHVIYCHSITGILLKVALNTINQTRLRNLIG